MVTSTWRDVPHHHVISRSSFSFYLAACVQSCPTLCEPVDSSLPGSSVHGILRPEYWKGLPLPFLRDLPNPGIKPKSLCLLHWQTDSLPLHHLGSPYLDAPSLSCGTSDLYLQHVDSQLRHAGSSSLNRDQTQALCIGIGDSQPLNHQGSPGFLYLDTLFLLFPYVGLSPVLFVIFTPMAVSELFYFHPSHFLKMYYFQLFENIKYLNLFFSCVYLFLNQLFDLQFNVFHNTASSFGDIFIVSCDLMMSPGQVPRKGPRVQCLHQPCGSVVQGLKDDLAGHCIPGSCFP